MPNQHFVKSKTENSTNDNSNTKIHNADGTKAMNASPLAWCRTVKSRYRNNRMHKSVDM